MGGTDAQRVARLPERRGRSHRAESDKAGVLLFRVSGIVSEKVCPKSNRLCPK